MTWICNQLRETFMHSPHVAAIYADDAALRRRPGLAAPCPTTTRTSRFESGVTSSSS